MFRIAFWNIQGKGPKSGIVDWLIGLTRETLPDILAIAECDSPTASRFLMATNEIGGRQQFRAVEGSRQVRVFYRGAISPMRVMENVACRHERFHILRLDRPAIPLLLVCVHMISRLRKSPADIDAQLRLLSREIDWAEHIVGHNNTIVLGDLNAHPFSDGVAAANGLHGVMSRGVASLGSRQVVFNDRPMMFNPMWRFYAGEGVTPQGTIFRRGKGDELAYFWNLFDQFLFRPAMLPYYRDGQVEIVTRIERRSLLDGSGLPDARAASDHLPILLTLDC